MDRFRIKHGPINLFVFSSLFLLAVIFLLAMGCGRALNRTAERRIREALPDLLGPARQYHVHVESAPERTLQGKLADVVIDGDDVQYPTGLLLDNLHIELKNVDVDTGRRQVRHIGEARFTITIAEKTFDEYLAGEAPAGETLRKMRVSLEDNNRVTVTGERAALGLGVPFRLTGPIRAAGPTRIELDPTRLVVIGIPISGGPLQFIKSRIETAVDLSRLSIPLQLSSVQTQRGRMILTGTLDANALLSRTQAAR